MVQWLGIHLAKRRLQVHPWSGTKTLDAAEPLSLCTATEEAHGATMKTQSSEKKKEDGSGDFPGSPVVKTLCSLFRGHRSGN